MSYGMMNEAYFVGKTILLDWINNFLDLNVEKVETCANGAIYCNLFDAIQPGTIPMKRVDFNVKQEFEYVKNWKLLQTAFQKAGVEKSIPIQRLIKARYQDNLEFMQWMYKYCRDNYPGDPDHPNYDASGRRSRSKGGSDYTGNRSTRRGRNARNPRYGRKENSSYQGNRGGNRPISANQRRGASNRGTGYQSSRGSASSSVSNMKSRNQSQNQLTAQLTADVEQMRAENARLEDSVNATQLKYDQLCRERETLSDIAKDIEKERDFYFNKVLEVENLCKAFPDQSLSLVENIYTILYQTEENSASANAPAAESGPALDVNVNANQNLVTNIAANIPNNNNAASAMNGDPPVPVAGVSDLMGGNAMANSNAAAQGIASVSVTANPNESSMIRDNDANMLTANANVAQSQNPFPNNFNVSDQMVGLGTNLNAISADNRFQAPASLHVNSGSNFPHVST